MKSHLVPFLALAAIAAPASAAEVQIQASGPVIELSVNETVKAKPDIATISAGVTSEAPTAVEAMRQNAAEMDAVIKRIKALGIAEDDIQTTGIDLGARYDYDRDTQKQVFRGYSASNRAARNSRSTMILRQRRRRARRQWTAPRGRRWNMPPGLDTPGFACWKSAKLSAEISRCR